MDALCLASGDSTLFRHHGFSTFSLIHHHLHGPLSSSSSSSVSFSSSARGSFCIRATAIDTAYAPPSKTTILEEKLRERHLKEVSMLAITFFWMRFSYASKLPMLLQVRPQSLKKKLRERHFKEVRMLAKTFFWMRFTYALKEAP